MELLWILAGLLLVLWVIAFLVIHVTNGVVHLLLLLALLVVVYRMVRGERVF